MDRRAFLSSGAGTAIVLTATTGASYSAEWVSGARRVQALSRATFERWLHSLFEVRRIGSMRTSRAQLIALRDGPQTAGIEQFHVIVRLDGPPADGLWELRHADGTELQLWLDAAGEDQGASLMRATFSLIGA